MALLRSMLNDQNSYTYRGQLYPCTNCPGLSELEIGPRKIEQKGNHSLIGNNCELPMTTELSSRRFEFFKIFISLIYQDRLLLFITPA